MEYTRDWKDFEIITSGSGEKYERWGSIILLRPDPQAIWSVSNPVNPKNINGKYIRSATGGGAWEWLKPTPAEWTIKYKKMQFIISPMNFKHTGLFPEQAVNWDKIQKLIGGKKDVKILNLFAYTGGATVAAAAAGAFVTHVDASRGMTDVAKRNMQLNGGLNARYIVEDCKKFCERELRRGSKYDAIIMDPPNFGRGANGEVWKLEEDLNPLVENCCKLLSDKPLFFLINNYTSSVQPAVIGNVLIKNLHGRGKVETYEIGLPANDGIILPCGCSSLVTF
jgi:23S rRNA (cytosine1962-C5)-methyltransferase